MTVTPKGILATIAAVLIAGVCVRLGFWQLDRLDQRRERNAAIVAASTLPTIELEGDSLEAVVRHPERYQYRRARARGAYDSRGDLLLRGRAMGGRPGVHLVTPLRLASGDQALLVLRGWIPAPDAATADPRPYAEPGAREVEGVIQEFVTEGGAIPMPEKVNRETVPTYQRLDPRALAGTIPYPLLPVYLQLVPTSDTTPPAANALQRVALPPLDEGPHLGYAIQWFGFAAVAILGMLIMIFRQQRDSR